MLRPGQQCGHNGRDLKPGEVIELPIEVGREVAGKLVPCTKDGVDLLGLSESEMAIAQALPHERESLRRMLRDSQ